MSTTPAVKGAAAPRAHRYPAKVKTMNAYENSYDLDYEDGDSESRVPARLIRPLATAAPRDLIPTPLTTTSQALETGGEL